MSEPLLDITGLTKRYGATLALDSLDLSLAGGTILGLVGPNGSGKSTLLKTIAGLLHPTSGEVRVFGLRPGRATKERTAYLPEVDCLHRDSSVQGMLGYVSAFCRDWSRERAGSLLSFMGLDPDARVAGLSKGMRARLKLVLALARTAPLVLLDEPLSGIDPSSRGRIVQAIIREYRTERQTLVFSTHEIHHAEPIFDQVLFLEKGRIRLLGEAEDLREQHSCSLEELFQEVYE